jgi:subtilisin family serine protease
MRKLLSAMLAVGLAASIAAPANAAPASPTDPASLLLAEPITVDTTGRKTIDPALRTMTGPVTVIVRLKDAPLAVANGDGYKQAARAGAARATTAQQQAHLAQLSQVQSSFVSQASALGAREVARFSRALNAVAMEVDASQIGSLAALPGVVSVRPARNYELDLSETVPYIGAAPADLPTGVDGTGIKVAVLDSGIDYTHVKLGGPGTLEAYVAAYGTSTSDPRNTTRDGLFPTSKVIDGYDFVGEAWPNGPLAPDPDPIDFEGHGTHVADIIAGVAGGGQGAGVAPGASLVAVKVCSAVSSSCNGIALLQGIEFALDPNGDGNLDDAVDVINMSLGSSYGQKEDDLGFASGNAVRMGVVVVASAGNSADRPYIVGSPSSQPEVISVAQTTVPSDKVYPITVGSTTVYGVAQPWAAAPADASATLVYITTSTATRQGCSNAAGANPFAPGSLTGQIVLMDRGTCAVSFKVSNARAAGAIAAIVANNASQGPGEYGPIFGFGGGTPDIPGYTVTLAEGNALKTVVGGTASVSASGAISIVGHMIASSSRGPSYSFNTIKPEIGAPGASVSAEAGTGTGTTAFGGTSGAAPMVAGAAALVLCAHPDYSPRDVKAVLVNTGETEIWTNKTQNLIAPITRIGGGEVRANKAIDTSTAAWVADDDNPVLSFGFRLVTKDSTFKKRVIVRNYSNERRTYTITPSFRYADDAASGAVVPSAPTEITVPANGTRSFVITLNVIASKLPLWGLNGGAFGGDGWRLQGNEFDGYLNIADGKDNIHLPWQILPHKAADVKPDYTYAILNSEKPTCDIVLTNTGATAGNVDAFALTGTSKRISKDELPGPGDNFAIIDLRAVGVRYVPGATPVVQFAVATSSRRAHPNYPAEFDIYIDSNGDGTDDYVVFNYELGLAFAATGQNAVYVQRLGTNTATAYFFADADLNSGNVILTVPAAAVGLSPDVKFNFDAYAFDNYFTGALTDAILDMSHTLSKPRYVLTGGDLITVPAGGSTTITVAPGTGTAADTSQTGILLMYRDAAGREWQTIPVRNK